MEQKEEIFLTDWVEQELLFIEKKLKQNLKTFYSKVPSASSENLVYPAEENTDWTASFWPGMLFLGKEYSRSDEFDEVIKVQLNSFQKRLDNQIELAHHDIGFLYTLTAVADYKVNQHQESAEMAVQAAELLIKRYSKKAEIIQAWGDLNDPSERGRMIIDCLMNLPLLYFASDYTGDSKYADIAYKHAKQTEKYIIRDNDTTFHTYFFDVETGEAVEGKTAQGYSDDSCWARGQAWGIYGFALSYDHTGDYRFLDSATRLANYFIEELPKDNVSYWDLVFKDGSTQPKDTSAAAIGACGLLELAKHLPLLDKNKKRFEKVGYDILKSLAENYSTKDEPTSNGLLKEGVYSYPENRGVEECMIWGDYYYLEGLIRLSQSWNKYW